MQDLKVIIKRLLLSFYRATAGKKPEKLILYRDGVSEGMFAEVQRAEIPQIIQACKWVPSPLPALARGRSECGREYWQGKGLAELRVGKYGRRRLEG